MAPTPLSLVVFRHRPPGMGDAEVDAHNERIMAAVNAGGDVHYSGNPQVTMAVHNGGDVRRDD